MTKVLQVINLPVAEDDIQDAYDWYESKRLGLGDDFIDELDEFSESLTTFPFKHRIIKKQIRLGVLRRFPYLVYYEVFDEVIHILSVVYGGRHPDYWEKRKS